MKLAFLRVFTWTKDFNPNLIRNTKIQNWICIYNLAQEYWSSKIIFKMTLAIGTPLIFYKATNSKTLGDFDRVLDNLDMVQELRDRIIVKPEGYAFFVSIDYEKIPLFCKSCKIAMYSIGKCQKYSNGWSWKRSPC